MGKSNSAIVNISSTRTNCVIPWLEFYLNGERYPYFEQPEHLNLTLVTRLMSGALNAIVVVTN